MPHLPDLRWRMKHVRTYGGAVPAAAGWYAIGHDERFLGLEAGRTYVYIGQTKNLRRRLTEHQPMTEQNPGLKKYLSNNTGYAKCWYATANSGATKQELMKIEASLIAKFAPCFNVQEAKRRNTK